MIDMNQPKETLFLLPFEGFGGVFSTSSFNAKVSLLCFRFLRRESLVSS